jgi:hypothetical protein
MNHDGHETSAHFDYVFHAAVKRTRNEFEKTVALLSTELLADFVDR